MPRASNQHGVHIVDKKLYLPLRERFVDFQGFFWVPERLLFFLVPTQELSLTKPRPNVLRDAFSNTADCFTNRIRSRCTQDFVTCESAIVVFSVGVTMTLVKFVQTPYLTVNQKITHAFWDMGNISWHGKLLWTHVSWLRHWKTLTTTRQERDWNDRGITSTLYFKALCRGPREKLCDCDLYLSHSA